MDFHPANVLRSSQGELVCVDFEFSAVNYALWDFMYASWLWCKSTDSQRSFLKAYLQEAGEPSEASDVDEVLADMRVVGHCHHKLGEHLACLRKFPDDGLAGYALLAAAAEDVLSCPNLRRQAIEGNIKDIGLIKKAMKVSLLDLWQAETLVACCDGSEGSPQHFAVNWDGSLTPTGRRRGRDLAIGLNAKNEVVLVSVLDSYGRRLCLRMDQGLPVTGICAPLGPVLPLRMRSHAGRGLMVSSNAGPKFSCDSGTPLSWEESKDYAERQGGRLFKLHEVQNYFKGNPALAPGQDQWAACINEEAHDLRDWVQIGDRHHHPGKSHVNECGGYPGGWWGNPQRWDCLLWRMPADPHVAPSAEGHYLEAGLADDAVEVYFDGTCIRLASRPMIAFECRKTTEGCFVTLAAYKPGECSQQFTVDGTGIICLTANPDLVWGIAGDAAEDLSLKLVRRGDSSEVIINLPEKVFTQMTTLTPVAPAPPPSEMHFRSELASHPGQALLVHKSGVDTLELGPVKNALDCILDGYIIRIAGSTQTFRLSSPKEKDKAAQVLRDICPCC
jgi:hypothetical protein